jgi:hypothetical protein
VRERNDEALQLRPREPGGADGLHVDVAPHCVEVTERARPDKPRPGEMLLEVSLEAEGELGQVLGDCGRHRATVP